MIKFSDGLLDAIKARADLAEIIGQHTPLQKKGREYVACCPFHQEKTPSFTVSNAKGFYHCFGCGAHGSVFDFVMQKENLNFPEAVEKLAHQFGIPLPKEKMMPDDHLKKSLEDDLIRIHDLACNFFSENLETSLGLEAREYLQKRNIRQDTCQRFQLGFAPRNKTAFYTFIKQHTFSEDALKASGLFIFPDDGSAPYDKFRGRLMFPILNGKGKVIAFGGRLLGPGEPKYLNSPETPIFKKSFELYNLYGAKQSQTKEPWCIVEGYMDAIALVQAGHENVVAPLGTAFTEHHMTKIWRFSDTPILCFDGDRAGFNASFRAAKRILPALRPGKTLSFMFLPEGHDPDSFITAKGLEEFQNRLNHQTTPLIDIIWKDILDQSSLKTPEGKAQIKKLILDTANLIQDPSIRNFYQRDLNQKLFESSRTSFFQKKNTPLKTWKPHIDPFLKEKILLSMLIHFPHFIENFEEELVSIDFSELSLNNFKKVLLEYYYSKKSLEKDILISYLTKQGWERVLSDLQNESTLIHIPSLRLEDVNDLMAECQEILGSIKNHHKGKEDLDSAKEALKSTFDEAAWKRFQALKNSFNKKE
jgi:DNA primase